MDLCRILNKVCKLRGIYRCIILANNGRAARRERMRNCRIDFDSLKPEGEKGRAVLRQGAWTGGLEAARGPWFVFGTV